MGKAGRWLRSFLTGKKDVNKEKAESSSPLPTKTRSAPILVPAPKEKKRWSFRRSAGPGKSSGSPELSISAPVQGLSEAEIEQKRHAMAVVVATAAAADAAVAAAQAAAAVIRLTTASTKQKISAVEEDAAVKIQSAFRAYLARKALCALRGLVKLQALVRGHLVRKQAAATLLRIQSLVTAQERARAQRIRMAEESHVVPQRQSIHRKSPQHPRSRQSHDMDRNAEENIKIVEMDLGGSRGNTKSRYSYSITETEAKDHRFSGYYGDVHTPSKIVQYQQFSPAPSVLTEMSPRTYSGHFEDFSFATAQSSPQYLSAISVPDPSRSCDYPFPNYMANTESSRAKARSQSAPRQRTDTIERQTSRRRPSVDGRNIPRSVKMQRSSSHVGMTANGYQYHPWSIKLDKSSMSLKDSECGSTSTVLTNINYCRSLAGFEIHRNRH
ncbi:IQ calmodulin-binding motif family protein [Musa troglodytarum]|uniref:IQ calmodulin-binding motif family protein n=1 Tax=Musa troglodytarum TaxID=320322 RepID=A0A9E7FBC6_9LILI|nr:IQ calmodulin-binding motif family protein [Musa troglodytarum]